MHNEEIQQYPCSCSLFTLLSSLTCFLLFHLHTRQLLPHITTCLRSPHKAMHSPSYYSRFRVFSPDCTLHSAITHVILVLERRTPTHNCAIGIHVSLRRSLVWLARPSLSAQGRKASKGRDGLAFIAISSHLAAWLPANEKLGLGCYEYYCQDIVEIAFIVLGKMAVAIDSISEESPRYPVKLGTKGHHFIEAC